MITFQSTYVYQTAPRERPSPVLCMAAIGILSHGWFFVDGPPAHLRCYTRADEIAPTMIAADAPYDDVILSPQFTRCFIIVLSRCKCKVGTKNVVLMKLWHGEFRFKTCHRSMKLRRAITSLILVRCRRFLELNYIQYVVQLISDRDASVRSGRESPHYIVA
jgi:hypothetical protein